MHHTLKCMHTSQTQNLWLWPKHPPLAFSVAKMSEHPSVVECLSRDQGVAGWMSKIH